MTFMRLIRPSTRLVSVISKGRSFICGMHTLVMEHQCMERPSCSTLIRFHSTHTSASREEKASQNEASSDPKQRILVKAMEFVPNHGWTIETLAAGAMDIGYPSVAHGMFTRGAIELVEYFMDSSLAKLRKTLSSNTKKLQNMTVAERVKFGIRKRLEMLYPIIDSWPQGMALGALPQNAPSTAKRLAQLSDEIWYFAGDKSTDMSWYTKRAILSVVYASTELFMLNDKSPDFQDTWAFLDRRIDETIQLGDLPQNLNDVVGMAGIGLQSMFSAVTSLTGPLVGQALSRTPLSNLRNPITAVESMVPVSMMSDIVSGLSFAAPISASSAEPGVDGTAFKPKDLKDIDEELGKFGGVDTKDPRN